MDVDRIVPRMAASHGEALSSRNSCPKDRLTEEEKIRSVAERILKEHKNAFLELAK